MKTTYCLSLWGTICPILFFWVLPHSTVNLNQPLRTVGKWMNLKQLVLHSWQFVKASLSTFFVTLLWDVIKSDRFVPSGDTQIVIKSERFWLEIWGHANSPQKGEINLSSQTAERDVRKKDNAFGLADTAVLPASNWNLNCAHAYIFLISWTNTDLPKLQRMIALPCVCMWI